MGTTLHWVDGPWPGKLAVAARPRGGDWLSEEIAGWKRAEVNTILSLLTAEEERDLDLENERSEAKRQGLNFQSFPILDRQVPTSEAGLAAALEELDADLSAGRNAVVHCRQGIGRTGLVASCLLLGKGFDPGAAVNRVTAARGISVPETTEQREWLDHYAAVLANSK